MRLTVRNGIVVTPGGRFEWDVVCEDGRIAALTEHGLDSGPGEEIDATGLLVFPGFIDPHVHSRDPGLTEKEDFTHSTRAAAAGGVTTICEMPNVVPPLTDVATFRDRQRHLERSAFVDFGLWGISLGDANLADLPGLIEGGVVGIKLFWGYALHRETKQLVYNLQDYSPDDLLLPPDSGGVLAVFRAVSGAGGLLAAHCEDRGILDAGARGLGRPIERYEDLLEARPDVAEPAAIALGVELARATSCRFHVVHVSSARGIEIVRRAQREGLNVSAETCPHYLTLDDRDFDQLGSVMKIYPPIRRAADTAALWAAVADGTIASIGSDHAPHTVESKRQPLASAPAGFVGVETIGPLLIDAMTSGRLTPERLSWVLSEGTARLYGLYPQKGTIVPGADADLTLVDPRQEWTIDNARLHSKHPLSPYHGRTVRGALVTTVLRGRVVMDHGELSGIAGGRLVRPVGPAG